MDCKKVYGQGCLKDADCCSGNYCCWWQCVSDEENCNACQAHGAACSKDSDCCLYTEGDYCIDEVCQAA
jgi:hypothetical protein